MKKTNGGHLGVMMLLVIDEAGFYHAGLGFEGFAGPVGRGCQDCCLTDLAQHQYLVMT